MACSSSCGVNGFCSCDATSIELIAPDSVSNSTGVPGQRSERMLVVTASADMGRVASATMRSIGLCSRTMRAASSMLAVLVAAG